ncbi:hypothetical protein Mal64_06650 [Pseudobythopirellula maris]|uniref:Uncharacterized protein n=1 Tax=Pseudobythopirellula maris TaxID=2527991 RepID=A0A5C5ZSP9_9BACT|nr:hypothetical protein [Pseudobythopirellula maris]TWT90280.1 hypothetical protein Mal64_06650 [Pseudobythopirellula maris]
MKFSYAFVVVLALPVTPLLVGCSQEPSPPATAEPAPADEGGAEEFDPHDAPMTEAEIESLKGGLTSYSEAIAKVKSLRDSIRDAIAAGNPPGAHRPLDELDIVLGHLTTVARENDVPKSEWETINMSAQRVRELLGEVHARIDGGEAAEYETVADDIQTAIEQLEGVQTN